MMTASLDATTATKHRVLLVDDHPVVRLGIAALINGEPDLEVCGEAADVPQAIEALQTLRPDIAVVDLGLTHSSGLELIKNVQRQAYAVPILVLSMYDEVLFAERVLRAGAQGYILKGEAMDKLLDAIRQVLRGDIYLSPKMTNRFLQSALQGIDNSENNPIKSLSDRELEVFTHLGQGHNRHEIADALYISVKTVETHRAHLMEKLNLKNATELTRYALYWVSPPERS